MAKSGKGGGRSGRGGSSRASQRSPQRATRNFDGGRIQANLFDTKVLCWCSKPNAEKIIKALETEPTTDNWIKVSERLPEQIGSYLVFYRDKEGLKCMAWGFYNSNGEWCVENKKLPTVTHWQPLPNAPKD